MNTENNMVITDASNGVTYTPFIDANGGVGYRCEHPDGRAEVIYLNPSGDNDDGQPNVFLYHEAGRTAQYVGSVMYVNVFDPGEV